MAVSASPCPDAAERACHVTLAGFHGPLELLLNLVKERRLDIMAVPLASVAEQYLAFVAGMEYLDLEVAAEYLLIAADLAFIKSRSLLPPLPAELARENEPTPEEVEERLRRRLIVYSKFREIALLLRDQANEAAGVYWRAGGDPAAELRQHYVIRSDRLSRALERALTQAKPEKRTIARERFSLVRQMRQVERRVRDEGRLSFMRLIEGYDRAGIIVTFLALLELACRQRLLLLQDMFDGELFVCRPEPEGELAVSNTDRHAP